MAVLPVRIVGDPILRSTTSPVTTFDAHLAKLVEDMFETMDDVGGVGLAATQVGVDLQIFTFDTDGLRGYVINPVLEIGEELQNQRQEGCLSVPGLGFHLPRAQWAKVTGVDVNGEPVTYEGEGLTARCLQHEFDHLQGMLYIDRLEGEDKKTAFRTIRNRSYNNVADQTQAKRSATLGTSFAASSSSAFGQPAEGN
ncbi:peptide deformylase [Neomicrococcus aestuarii]|uniref:Peptide deformylase n=1 Tax=Neomicrococcus aestuarii TaxID=556325 RepID=A0A1L2ZLA8_9MICC|nr:peptide deformylase [Neomicrococcus aestuarii]APF39802.1 peptide deformylase [Neomicrococcus aestuarii]MBB5513837.1 peptide deformylase [Neomicrococcus aestuarii]